MRGRDGDCHGSHRGNKDELSQDSRRTIECWGKDFGWKDGCVRRMDRLGVIILRLGGGLPRGECRVVM